MFKEEKKEKQKTFYNLSSYIHIIYLSEPLQCGSERVN